MFQPLGFQSVDRLMPNNLPDLTSTALVLVSMFGNPTTSPFKSFFLTTQELSGTCVHPVVSKIHACPQMASTSPLMAKNWPFKTNSNLSWMFFWVVPTAASKTVMETTRFWKPPRFPFMHGGKCLQRLERQEIFNKFACSPASVSNRLNSASCFSQFQLNNSNCFSDNSFFFQIYNWILVSCLSNSAFFSVNSVSNNSAYASRWTSFTFNSETNWIVSLFVSSWKLANPIIAHSALSWRCAFCYNVGCHDRINVTLGVRKPNRTKNCWHEITGHNNAYNNACSWRTTNQWIKPGPRIPPS